MVRFKIRDYPFGDLAQMYYPDHNYDSALRLFRREMHDTRGMWQAIVAFFILTQPLGRRVRWMFLYAFLLVTEDESYIGSWSGGKV